jgi:hypothetical protein
MFCFSLLEHILPPHCSLQRLGSHVVVCFAKNNDYTTNVTANQGTGFANSHLRSIPVKVHGVHGSVSFESQKKSGMHFLRGQGLETTTGVAFSSTRRMGVQTHCTFAMNKWTTNDTHGR